jgi:hypothetical protein
LILFNCKFRSTIEISGIEQFVKTKTAFKDAIDFRVVENASTYFDSVTVKLGNIKNLEYVSIK